MPQARLDSQRNANNESFDAATKAAAHFSGASQAASAAAKEAEPVNRKERAQYTGRYNSRSGCVLTVTKYHHQAMIKEPENVDFYTTGRQPSEQDFARISDWISKNKQKQAGRKISSKKQPAKHTAQQ